MEAVEKAVVESEIGPYEVVRDWSWAHGNAVVQEIRTESGRSWVVKRHRDPDRFAAELRAYREWTSALGTHAPVLRAYDDDQLVLVVSRLDGLVEDDTGAEVHRRAGALLRRFHGAATLGPVASDPNGAASKRELLESWVARGRDLLDSRELAFARSSVERLGTLPALPLVPCHRDFTPRNWLVDGDRVNIVDFELATPDVWVTDLGRLWWGAWRARPDLCEAFLDGYGREPTATEHAILSGDRAVTAIWHLVWARSHGEAALERSSREVLAALMTEHL